MWPFKRRCAKKADPQIVSSLQHARDDSKAASNDLETMRGRARRIADVHRRNHFAEALERAFKGDA